MSNPEGYLAENSVSMGVEEEEVRINSSTERVEVLARYTDSQGNSAVTYRDNTGHSWYVDGDNVIGIIDE